MGLSSGFTCFSAPFCSSVVVLLSAALSLRSLRSLGERWKAQARVSLQRRARVETPHAICGILCWIYFFMYRLMMYSSRSTMTLTSRGLPCLVILLSTCFVSKNWILYPAPLPDASSFSFVHGTFCHNWKSGVSGPGNPESCVKSDLFLFFLGCAPCSA